MPAPSAALAAHILDRLAEEGLLRPDDVTDALPRFADGTLGADDWVRLVRRAATPPAPEPESPR